MQYVEKCDLYTVPIVIRVCFENSWSKRPIRQTAHPASLEMAVKMRSGVDAGGY